MTLTHGCAPSTATGGASESSTRTRTIHRIGETVDRQIKESLWRLLRGEIEFHHITPGLSAWYMAGANVHGASCCQDEIDRLTRERDMWYACYANRWTPGEYMRRQTDALWDEVVSE